MSTNVLSPRQRFRISWFVQQFSNEAVKETKTANAHLTYYQNLLKVYYFSVNILIVLGLINCKNSFTCTCSKQQLNNDSSIPSTFQQQLGGISLLERSALVVYFKNQ